MSEPEIDTSVRDRVNGRIRAINPVTQRLVAERTAYSSQLIRSMDPPCSCQLMDAQGFLAEVNINLVETAIFSSF